MAEVSAAWGQCAPLALVVPHTALWIAGAFLAGVIVGLLASHELALYGRARRRGSVVDLTTTFAPSDDVIALRWSDARNDQPVTFVRERNTG